MESLGERIYRARIASNMNQSELAKKIGVSAAVISIWENDKSKPKETNLNKLETVLGALGPPTVGDWLRISREGQSLSVQELSNLSTVSVATISNVENGRTSPRQDTIDRLEEALNTAIPEETAEILENEVSVPGVSDAETFNPYSRDTWPDVGGVYVLYDKSGRPAYIGQSNNIARRIKDHIEKRWYIEPLVQSGKYVQIEDKDLRRSVEKALIRFLDSYALINRHLTSRDLAEDV